MYFLVVFVVFVWGGEGGFIGFSFLSFFSWGGTRADSAGQVFEKSHWPRAICLPDTSVSTLVRGSNMPRYLNLPKAYGLFALAQN